TRHQLVASTVETLRGNRHRLLRRALGLGDSELCFEMLGRNVGHVRWRARPERLQVLVGLIRSGREIPVRGRDVVESYEILCAVDIGLRGEPDDAELFLR